MSNRTIVVKLDPATEGETLREGLAGAGFVPHKNPSARWAFKGPGVTATFYSSGKLVVQGKGSDDFAASWLGEAGGGASELEVLDRDLVGTDESGKGDYFGPLVVAAVLVPKGQDRVLREIGVRDSKEVGDRAAKEAARAIRAGYPHAVVAIGPARYNELYEDFGNLNRLLGWATAQAVAEVLEKHPCDDVLSDKFGNERHIADALRKRGIEVNLVQRVRAESNPAVAAASLLARERFLTTLDRLSKEIGVRLPKGAGEPVIGAARQVFRQGGREALAKVAKLHFKTTVRVTSELF